MCGIAGFLDGSTHSAPQDSRALLERMTNALSHRGPDAAGFWHGESAAEPVHLGHRRLSIIDLSDTGAQPMASHCGRYVIAYNGEIYNFQSLRHTLEQESRLIFRGHSDTEILVNGFAIWGVGETLKRIRGMFAIALWDRQDKILHLIRDHVGKKPLYYGVSSGRLLFGSELKALRPAMASAQIDRRALALYTRFGYVPAPHTIYEGIFKLPPGHIASLRLDDLAAPGIDLAQRTRAYWSMADIAARRELSPLPYSQQLQTLENELTRAVRERMVADVPIGAFLSGGIDSSLVTALMQTLSDRPVRTFCIGFEESGFDESPHAAAIAAHLGTAHETLRISAADTRSVIPVLAAVYDEPFADYSQIPTWHVCRLARGHTTVALTGDGGDESFAGYSRYFMAQSLHRSLKNVPRPLRAALAQAMLAVPEQRIEKAVKLLPFFRRYGLNGKRLHSIARFMDSADLQALFMRVMSICQTPQNLLAQPENASLDLHLPAELEEIERMMLSDMQFYLPDDVLVKTDRASMAHALELRSPLLDVDVMTQAWSMALHHKVFAGQMRGKRPLYDLLARHVPEALINRPKQGFTVPLAAWLRGPLRDWAGDLLSPSMIQRAGLYDSRAVQAVWQDFSSGRQDHHGALWAVLMAQSWHERWMRDKV